MPGLQQPGNPIANLTVFLRDWLGMVDLYLVWWQLFSVSLGVFRVPFGFLPLPLVPVRKTQPWCWERASLVWVGS